MPSPIITTRPQTRFDQLTPDKRKDYRGEGASLLLTGKFRSFTGKSKLRPYYEIALKVFESDVCEFQDAIVLIDGFVLMCNARRTVRSNRAYEGMRSNLKGGLLKFATEKQLMGRLLVHWPKDLGKQFSTWLQLEAMNRKGEPLNANTARRYWGEFSSFFAVLAEQPRMSGTIPDFEPFPNNPFSGAQDDTKKTKSIGLPALIAALLVAREEFQKSVMKVHYAQSLFAKSEVLPDLTKRSKLRFRNLDALLWYLQKNYPDGFPAFTSWRKTDSPLFEAINKLHGGWRSVSEYFYPTPEACVAPIVLMTIYSHMNVEPLRALQFKQVSTVSVMRNKHVQVRIELQPGKNRGDPYSRSFPVDGNDFASPSSILDFMKLWTERIRPEAGIYSDCYFIFATKERLVKAFVTATLDGKSGDTKWMHHLRAFCAQNNLPRFNLRELRQTALDFGRLISDDDIREVAALQGGSSQTVLDAHYRSDAAENRHNAKIAQLQASKERFVRTSGKSHQLGSQGKDISAATPGCKCADPYSSPIPGEVQNVLCGAFGSCPGCPHGSPQLGSASGFARLLQLRQALIDAKANLSRERWLKRYQRPLQVLDELWLPQFEPHLMERAKRISLPPIGVIE